MSSRTFHTNSGLKHPIIINTVSTNDKRDFLQSNGSVTLSSYIIMEFSPYGDFYNILNDYGAHLNDKITRTYFRQLIKGLKYLHANKVAHLDLKSENLLLGEDFNLKMIDFDVSYIEQDEKFLGWGSMSHRCPEMCESTSVELRLKDPYAADIYSASILLFMLKSEGVNPYFENRADGGIDFLT